MTTAVIGGEEIKVDLPSFRELQAAWRYIAPAQGSADPMVAIKAILGVVAVGQVGANGADEALEDEAISEQVKALSRKLKPAETLGLRTFLNSLLIDIGLAKPAGEATPAKEGVSPSPAISTD